MKIEHLQECLHLARTLNFTQTSRAFYTTQPVLSKHISAIEHELGIQIFARSTHGVSLTAEGKVFISDAAKVVKNYDSALDNVMRMKAGACTQLNIGYLMGIGFMLLPQAIRDFSDKNPQTALKMYSLEITDIPEALRNDLIDIGITTDNGLYDFPSTEYRKSALFPDRHCAIVPEGHRLYEEKQISLSDLRDDEFLTPMPSFIKDDPFDELIVDGTSLAIHYDVNEVMSFHILMMTKRYVSIAYAHLQSMLGDSFAYIPVEEFNDAFSTFAVWKKDREQKILLSFIEALTRVAQDIKPMLHR